MSGDHCKSASDLGVPMVALGLLYRRGYFRQTIDADGVQQHSYAVSDFARLGMLPVASPSGGELTVSIPFPDREVKAKVWTIDVGRVPLLLLDTDTADNHRADRPITSLLYVRGREMRLAQELILAVGGARALDALGITPSVWHLNEGHSALLQVERLARRAQADGGESLEKGLLEVRRSTAFTTHTQVAAGHETFDEELATRHLRALVEGRSLSADACLRLGWAQPGQASQSFNLSALALRTSAWVNGVSELNAEVSDEAWSHLRAHADVPKIEAITNGVHVPTWQGGEIAELLAPAIANGSGVLEASAQERILELSDLRVWDAHRAQKSHLGAFVRSRMLRQFGRHGRSPEALRDVDNLFDEKVLTLGFARRFATYKRADLLFRDIERTRSLFMDDDQPLQIVLAGKAHPADRPGQELIQKIFALGQDPSLRSRVLFLEDFDLEVARMLVQGVDVWLNTPRRPLEACGTSGMKAAINGVLNCSILDGWWQEGFAGDNGWAIDGGSFTTEAEQDEADSEALYRVLAQEIKPLFYERDENGLPPRWVSMMKRSIATGLIGFSSRRMVADYVTRAYMPLAVEAGSQEPPTP